MRRRCRTTPCSRSRDRAADVVLVEPRSRTLDLLIPGADSAGFAPAGLVAPDCDVPDAVRAGAVSPGAVFAPGASADVVACYSAGDGFGLLIGPLGASGRVAVVDGRTLFTNEHLAENGNAALALNLMGRHPLVVWYVPGLADTDLENADPTLGELTPPWVSPVIVLLLVAGVAAAIWRGRRFGPLVAGAASGVGARVRDDRGPRAALRPVSRRRSTPPTSCASPRSVASAARSASAVRPPPPRSRMPQPPAPDSDRAAVRGILIDDIPRGDADLVALDARLRHLEDAVRAAVRPERNSP